MNKTKKTTETSTPNKSTDLTDSTGVSEASARRLTGAAGIAAAVALIVEVPLYFVYSGPPRTRTSWPAS